MRDLVGLRDKVLQRYWRFSRALTLGAQGAIIDAQQRVLLVRHGYRPGWHFPGGGVERNEMLLDALARELREEAGIHFTKTPKVWGVYANFKAFPGDHVVLYVITDWTQPAVPEPNYEIAEQGFFGVKMLPDGTAPAVRRRFAEIFGDKPIGAEW